MNIWEQLTYAVNGGPTDEMLWEQFERLMEADAPEDKALKAGSGSATERCAKTGMPKSGCAHCNPKPKEQPAGKKGKDYWEDDIDDLDNSRDKRNKQSMSYEQWAQKINDWTKNFASKHGGEALGSFREYEKELAYSNGYGTQDKPDPEAMKKAVYGQSTSWDDYIVHIAKTIGYGEMATALQQQERKKLRRAKYGSKKPGGATMPGEQPAATDEVSLERGTPEFEAWEKNVALVGWKQMYEPELGPGAEPDPQAWDELMYIMANKNDAGVPWWKWFNDKGNPSRLYDIMKRKYDASMGSKMTRNWERERQEKMFQQAGEKGAIQLYNPQAIMHQPKQPQRQMSPSMFKKKRYGADDETEKRKFPTWWDPFGFKGKWAMTDRFGE